jgi:hypothetical protein
MPASHLAAAACPMVSHQWIDLGNSQIRATSEPNRELRGVQMLYASGARA